MALQNIAASGIFQRQNHWRIRRRYMGALKGITQPYIHPIYPANYLCMKIIKFQYLPGGHNIIKEIKKGYASYLSGLPLN